MGGEFLSPRAREAQILWFVASQGFLRRFHRRMCKTEFARRALAGNGMRCARRGSGRFVQTTENPAASPGISKLNPRRRSHSLFTNRRCSAALPVRSTPYPRRQALPSRARGDRNSPGREGCNSSVSPWSSTSGNAFRCSTKPMCLTRDPVVISVLRWGSVCRQLWRVRRVYRVL